MQVIKTHELPQNFHGRGSVGDWIYCGLDSMVTAEVAEALLAQLDETSRSTYEFTLQLRAPLLEMMLTGTLVDPWERESLARSYSKDLERITNDKGSGILDRIANAVWGKPLNPGSYKQLQEFFYECMALPEQYSLKGGERKVTTDRNALEKLQEYLYARPIIECILQARDLRKKLSVLRGRSSRRVRDALLGGDNVITTDGRFRTSYNIGGTESGRLSSSTSAYGAGTNSQNITEQLRRIFIADRGCRLAYIDLATAESLAVAYLSGDENYIKACESGDVHTYVCRLCWPELDWTGQLVDDRAIAERPYYRHFSYRDMGKRGGHLSNYYGRPGAMARHLKLPERVTQEFQYRYFSVFDKLPAWHRNVAERLEVDGQLTTAMGFRRYFLGRRDDDSTLREAIAFEPQSLVAFILNTGLLRLWRARICQPLMQIHDALLIQYPAEREDEIIPQALRLMEVPTRIRDINGVERTLTLRCDAAVGWNWAKEDPRKKLHADGNPGGLRNWKPGADTRKRPLLLGVA